MNYLVGKRLAHHFLAPLPGAAPSGTHPLGQAANVAEAHGFS